MIWGSRWKVVAVPGCVSLFLLIGCVSAASFISPIPLPIRLPLDGFRISWLRLQIWSSCSLPLGAYGGCGVISTTKCKLATAELLP
ncbi:hypothetical protein C8J57DRAFT_1370201 [Mycena rebaudengoi]|nr:hypothetical protein C8J57DRAFT_1370201 [Mycena rebaudengoi]